MPNENVGIKAGITAKLETRDEVGNLKKTTFFYPDLGVSVEASDEKEAKVLAEEKAVKVKKEKEEKKEEVSGEETPTVEK
jgi:hypothetical protein